MKTITDDKGRTWELAINLLTLGRVRNHPDLGKMNLVEIVLPDSAVGPRLLADPCELGLVLWCLCQDQAAAKGVAESDFYAALSGDCLEDGFRGIVDGAVNFSQKALQPTLRNLVQKSRAMQEKAAAWIQGQGERLNEVMDKAIAASLAEADRELQKAAAAAETALEEAAALAENDRELQKAAAAAETALEKAAASPSGSTGDASSSPASAASTSPTRRSPPGTASAA
jgi:Sec-independent protein translocase protein TatA